MRNIQTCGSQLFMTGLSQQNSTHKNSRQTSEKQQMKGDKENYQHSHFKGDTYKYTQKVPIINSFFKLKDFHLPFKQWMQGIFVSLL